LLNLISKAVIHKSLGLGHIVSINDKIITVQFGEKQRKFSFPSIFNDILAIQDKSLMHEIQELCENESYMINRQKEERMTEFETRFAPAPNSKPPKSKRAKQYRDNNNIALKCNYCDGGRTEEVFGYQGICSNETLHKNVTTSKRPWCSAATCMCKQYSNGEIDRKQLDQNNADGVFACYESRLLLDWTASAGRHQSDKNNDKPIKMANARINRLCVLTTKQPDEIEIERKIFAAFIISEVEIGNDTKEGSVRAHPQYRIQLTPEEAENVHFWDYHKNKSKPEMPFWGSGLIRYITDVQSIHILEAMLKAAVDADKKALILEMLENYCKVTAVAAAK